MKSSSLRAAGATFFMLGLPLAAGAAPADPRLVTGVVEWPAALTNEPFVIVRGNDGVLYYVGIAAPRRERAVTAGSRIAVLGLEGRQRHEITAVAVGSGATAEAALAELQDLRPSASPASAVPVASVPAPTAAPRAAAPTQVATAPMIIPTDNHRWIEISGEVESLNGRTVVLKVDGGRVTVDMSSLKTNLERSLAPGTTVKVYGVPVELRFKAMGFVEPNARAHGPRQP